MAELEVRARYIKDTGGLCLRVPESWINKTRCCCFGECVVGGWGKWKRAVARAFVSGSRRSLTVP